MKKILLFISALTLLIGAGCQQPADQIAGADTKTKPADFGIYLVKNNQLLISQDDIASYNPDTHTFKLTDEAVERLGKTYDTFHLNNGLYGQKFSIMLQGQVQYSGVFWSGLSSQSHDGIVLLDSTMFLTTKELQIAGSYPGIVSSLSTQKPDLLKYFKSVGKATTNTEKIMTGSTSTE